MVDPIGVHLDNRRVPRRCPCCNQYRVIVKKDGKDFWQCGICGFQERAD